MGTGEIVRYISAYGSSRVSKAVLLGVIPPFVLKTDDNPEGVDREVFDDIKAAIAKRSLRLLQELLRQPSTTSTSSVPSASVIRLLQASFNVAASSSPYASYAVVDTWLTDFRADLPKIDVPTLVLHGTADRILPVRGHCRTPRRTHRGRQGRPDRGRPPQHRLDAPTRRSPQRAPQLPRQHDSCLKSVA